MLSSFKKFVDKHQLSTIQNPILVAVSGGADSVVLCHHFHSANIPFAIAHVNFGLRGAESDADDIFVAGLAETYNVPHHRKFVDTKSIATSMGISTQMAARSIRYKWFNEIIDEHQYTGVAVGTHLNDQIETAILNFTKETGLKGLTGIPAVRQKIYRPLINATRKEIVDYANNNELSWRYDSSNNNTYYQRNKIRLELIPVLKEINPSFEKSFAHSFEHLKQAQEFLHHQAETILKRELVVAKSSTSFPRKLLDNVANSYLLFNWLQPHGFTLDQLNKLTSAHQGATFIGSQGAHLSVERNEFVLTNHFAKKLAEPIQVFEHTNSFTWNGVCYSVKRVSAEDYKLKKDASVGQFDADKLCFPLTIRSWQEGDKIKPLGLKGRKKVSDIFIDNKLSNSEKNSVLILVSNMKLAWIKGLCTSAEYAISSTTKNIYLINSIFNE